MRKLMIPGLFVALFALLAGTGAAEACGSKAGTAKSASASSCGAAKQADAKSADAAVIQAQNADYKSGSCSAYQAAGAGCASKAKAASAAACSEACKAACGIGNSAAMVSNDVFIQSYMNVQKGLLKGCATSSAKAAAAWRSHVEAMIADENLKDHAEPLGKLNSALSSWPSEIDAQRSSFADVSEWMIGYCEKFPERAAGTNVVSCPESGNRWVQTEDVSGNPFAG